MATSIADHCSRWWGAEAVCDRADDASGEFRDNGFYV